MCFTFSVRLYSNFLFFFLLSNVPSSFLAFLSAILSGSCCTCRCLIARLTSADPSPQLMVLLTSRARLLISSVVYRAPSASSRPETAGLARRFRGDKTEKGRGDGRGDEGRDSWEQEEECREGERETEYVHEDRAALIEPFACLLSPCGFRVYPVLFWALFGLGGTMWVGL